MMKNTEQQWTPILTGSEAEETLQILQEIAEVLQTPPPAWIPDDQHNAEPFRVAKGASLAFGSAGIALFYAYMAKLQTANPDYNSLADRFLNKACDALESVDLPEGLFQGFTGIAWTVEHLQNIIYKSDEIDPDCDPNEEIDHMLRDFYKEPEKYDLWSGCVGLGVYALERYPRPSAKSLLEFLIEFLALWGGAVENGIGWFTPPEIMRFQTRIAYPDGYYDLGVAHGMAGIVSFFANAYRLGISESTIGYYLPQAIDLLLPSRRSQPGLHKTFPHYLTPIDHKPITTNTVGWCHSNLGIAAAILSAAQCTGETHWKNEAIDAAKASIRFLLDPGQHFSFTDPTICHGAAGIAHIFNRFFQATGDEIFKDEAVKWFKHLRSLRHPGNGIAGFSRFGKNEDGDMVVHFDPGFIQGAAGIGLALTAALSSHPPNWDRTLLLSPTGDKE
jgi:lantibiotic modifying enzyme